MCKCWSQSLQTFSCIRRRLFVALWVRHGGDRCRWMANSYRCLNRKNYHWNSLDCQRSPPISPDSFQRKSQIDLQLIGERKSCIPFADKRRIAAILCLNFSVSTINWLAASFQKFMNNPRKYVTHKWWWISLDLTSFIYIVRQFNSLRAKGVISQVHVGERRTVYWAPYECHCATLAAVLPASERLSRSFNHG